MVEAVLVGTRNVRILRPGNDSRGSPDPSALGLGARYWPAPATTNRCRPRRSGLVDRLMAMEFREATANS